MARMIFHRSGKQTASAPGTLVFTGQHRPEKIEVTVLDYGTGDLAEKTLANIAAAFPYRDSDTTSWINICGLHDTGALDALGTHYGLHPLVMEDIVNTRQRPKFEDYNRSIFLVCRMVSFNDDTGHVEIEQVSIVLMPHVVLSFQERAGDVFEPVRERIRVGKGRIRAAGADYLAYALLDAVVDHYFVILEKLSDRIETLEEDLLSEPSREHLERIHELKREMILLRRSVWPLREVLAGLSRSESTLVSADTVLFLRDVLDHTTQVVEVVESFRDILSGLQDLYLTSISNRMNEVMKVLTIIATVFIPLSFIAGVYGMNFDPQASRWNMPELSWPFGYPMAVGLMAIVGGGMLVYFWKKGWFR